MLAEAADRFCLLRYLLNFLASTGFSLSPSTIEIELVVAAERFRRPRTLAICPISPVRIFFETPQALK